MKNIYPIRVLHVLNKLDRGGTEAMIMNLYRHIDRNIVQFDFLVHNSAKGLYEDEVLSLGGRVYRIDRMKWYNTYSYYKKTCDFFQNHMEIKVVHVHLGSCAFWCLKAANKYNIFSIAHSHSVTIINSFSSLAYSLFTYPIRFTANYLFGCSEKSGISRYGRRYVNSNKYSNFPNAIDLKKFHFNIENRANVRTSLNIAQSDILIGSIGRLATVKNPDKIYAIFKSIIKINKHCKCLWVGTGELEQKYRRIIAQEDLSDRIIMTGVREDVNEIMSALDGLIMPSFSEGLPVTIIEAQAAGLPCLLSDSITREVQLTDLVRFKQLKKTDQEWALDIYDQSSKYINNRLIYDNILCKSGYEIHQSAKHLIDFYIKHIK